MAREVLRTNNGSKLAEIEHKANESVLYSPSGTRLGYYNHKTNTTHLPNGSRYGQGNQLTQLIR